MMGKVSIQKGMQASRPILAFIDKVVNTFPKTNYVVYYKNHMHEDEQVYRNIDQLKEILLPNRELQLKVINFENGRQVIIKSNSFECINKKILITFNYLTFTAVIAGTVLNQSESNEGLVNLSLAEKSGYDDFYKYRKKYKTLENITKKIDFQIDHRIKIIIGGKEHQFDLEDKKKQHYFLNIFSFQQEITVVLQQTTSIQNFVQVQKVEQIDVDIKVLTQGAFSYNARLKFSNKFEVSFLFNLIKNENLSSADFVSIRVLQSSVKSNSIKIGTQSTIHLNECLKVQPLVGNRFFDYEWGYLNENLSKIQGNNCYQFLDKITQSAPQYAHFINQEMIDLKQSNFVIFQLDGTLIKVPIAYILKGLNHVQCQKFSIKFFIDSSRINPATISEKLNIKRIYQANVRQIWNMSKLNKFLDKNNTNNFCIKIMNEDTYYYIPFTRKTVNKSQFRKESKELVMRSQVTQMASGKYYSLQNNQKSKDQLILIESNSINPFYLIKSTSSSVVSVQLIISNSIIMQGSLSREKIQSLAGKPLIHLLTSLDGSSKIGIVFSFTEISQPADSAATYYNFRHRLSFAEAGQSEEVTYDIEVQFEKQSNIRSLRNKISPQVKRETNEGVIFRQFSGNSGVYRKQSTLNFTLKIRKMFFNEQLNHFDNQILLSKDVAINPTAQILKLGKHLMVKLQKQCFQSLQFDVYDSNIKKRMKYFLQVYAQKNSFLDYKDSSYKIKIPPLLWTFMNCPGVSNFQISSHLNRRNKNTDKFSFTTLFNLEIILDHYNYNDGISLVMQSGQMAYSKFLKAIKLKCDVLKESIGWAPQSDWYFGVLTFPSSNFYFMAQRLFDAFEDKKDNSKSSGSRKTVSRERSNRSDKHKIDPLAKTISNLDLFKLKQNKNELVAQGRQLTARYVKRQEKIVALTKKLAQLDESIRKKQQQDAQVKQDRKKVRKQNVKMKEFYRSICECGALNPPFNGYCDQCLQKLKQSYEAYMREYKQKSYEYEKMVFDKFNKKEKIERLKRKIVNMKNQNIVIQAQDDSPQLLIKDLEEKSLKKSIEELQVEIFQLQQQKNSLVTTSNWQMSILEEKIAQQDGAIYKSSQQYDSLKNKLAQLVKITKKQQSSDT